MVTLIMAKNIYVIRHGETDWNAQGIVQGFSNIPLNEKGKEQALSIKAKLQTINFDFVLCSDLDRARQTFEIAVGDDYSKPIFDERIREINLGPWEGKTREEVFQEFSEEDLRKWRSHRDEDYDTGAPGGETNRQHLKRVVGCLNEFCSKNEFTNLAVFTHGGSILRLIHHATNFEVEFKGDIANCSIHHFIVNEQNNWNYKGLY